MSPFSGRAPEGTPRWGAPAPLAVRTKGGIPRLSRRGLLGAAAVAAGVSIVPSRVLGKPRRKAPSDKLALACVGLGAMGADNLEGCQGEAVVALCDVDDSAAATTFQRYPNAKRYRDYRRMLEREKGIDAVIVATPDHTHAVVTAAAMKAGKHVYTQMPLAHDVWEVRELARLARETKVATQMGNERYSGPTIRQVVEWIQAGCIGEVTRVDCWTNRPRWPQGLRRPAGTPPVPDSLAWDLWLGPAPERAYHPAYHPYLWRGWRDFGTGALGAMGCHVMDGAYWALKLAEAKAVTVEADAVGGTDASYPTAATVRYRFAARGDMPPVTLTWHDGGRRPTRPEEWPRQREFVGSNGTILYGAKGKLTFGALTAGTNPGQAGPRFVPESLRKSVSIPKPTIPRIPARGKWVHSSRHIGDWIRACKGGRPACSRFEIAAALTEIALLGNVAAAAGKPIEYDLQKGTITNAADAARLLRREYRKGWTL